MEKLFPREVVERYATRGFRRIDGWLAALDARLIRSIGMAQDELGVAGALGEIGVHHGKLFILLYLMLSRGEKAFAIDIFDRQELNVDGSGKGDLAVFLRNMERVAGSAESVELFQSNSTDLQWHDIEQRIEQNVRLFSIDGGHTAEITYHDIDLANRSLVDEGVVIVDDYFNADWPGVSEGTAKFLCRNTGALTPIAIGENKIFLARPEHAAKYSEALIRGAEGRYIAKKSGFFGSAIPVFRDPKGLYERLKQSDFARTHRNHPLAEKIKPALRRLLGG
jgi:hypothetical protein